MLIDYIIYKHMCFLYFEASSPMTATVANGFFASIRWIAMYIKISMNSLMSSFSSRANAAATG